MHYAVLCKLAFQPRASGEREKARAQRKFGGIFGVGLCDGYTVCCMFVNVIYCILYINVLFNAEFAE